MKNNFLIYIGCIFFISTCRMPSNPLGEIKIIKRLETINTVDDCLDLDVDISDNVLVAAANYAGYYIYDLQYSNDIIASAVERAHITSYEMDDGVGNNRAQSVILSKNQDFAFILNKEDNLWIYNYDKHTADYIDYINGDFSFCGSGVWTDFTLDADSEDVTIYAIVKHQSGGFIWSQDSKSVVSKTIANIAEYHSYEDTNNENSGCHYIANQSYVTNKIFYSDNLLTVGYSDLGVKIFKFVQASQDTCIWVDNIGDLVGVSVDNANCPTWGEINENDFFPTMVAKYDSPGGVEAIYSKDNIVFTGLSYSNGCMMTQLNTDGSVIGSHQFAIGYTIKGIHEDNGLLALAAGHDGILLYNWNGNDVSFMGKIETAYANNVKISIKVSGNIIFAATENGIEIIQIDR